MMVCIQGIRCFARITEKRRVSFQHHLQMLLVNQDIDML
jgi:hypothetical protein